MHRVVALVRNIQQTFELSCAVEVFSTLRPNVPQLYDFEICADAPGPVQTSAGYPIEVAHGLEALESADTVVIPGWLPVETPLTADVEAALRRAHSRGARLVSICSGAFALARTGVLDGRTATTHEARAEQLRREFPHVTVIEALYVDHGDVATSSGAGAGIDLCLHLVERDFGAAHSALIAASMVVPRRPPDWTARPGSTSAPEAELPRLAHWVDSRLQERLTVDTLAAQLNVSPRTLARRTADELGTSPGEWILSRRIAAARQLLEDTDLTVDAIADRVGLGSAVNLRRRFRAQVGTTPSAYRQNIRGSNTLPRR